MMQRIWMLSKDGETIDRLGELLSQCSVLRKKMEDYNDYKFFHNALLEAVLKYLICQLIVKGIIEIDRQNNIV